MKKRLLILLPLILVASAVGFKLTRPGAPEAKPKVAGDVYVLPKEFLLNLRGGRLRS